MKQKRIPKKVDLIINTIVPPYVDEFKGKVQKHVPKDSPKKGVVINFLQFQPDMYKKQKQFMEKFIKGNAISAAYLNTFEDLQSYNLCQYFGAADSHGQD